MRDSAVLRSGHAHASQLALTGLSLSMLMASLDTSIANTGLPVLARAFTAPFQQVQWVVIAYLLAVTTTIVGAGRLGDTVGRRRLLLAGIASFTLASFLCGVAPSLGVLIAARFAQGLGAAAMMALTVAFVGETVPKERTGSAMGLLGTMSAVGTAFGPSVGGFLIVGLGWRAMFLINVPLGLAALFLVWRFLPADGKESMKRGSDYDLLGTILLAATLAAFSLAMTVRGEGFGAVNVALIVAAGVGGLLFVIAQGRRESPLLPLATLRDSTLYGSLIMSALVATVMMSTLVVGPFYLTRALGLGPATVGLVLSVGPSIVALTGVPAGRLADRFGARRTSVVGLVLIAVGSGLLSLIPTRFGVPGYLFPIAIMTAGYGLFQTSNNTVVMTGVSSGSRGVISGMLGLSRNLGLITGAAAMGSVFALATGASDVSAAPPQSVAGATRITFALAAALIVAALGIALRGRSASRSV